MFMTHILLAYGCVRSISVNVMNKLVGKPPRKGAS